MTPQELRASVIQQAVQGKLVEQLPEEGTGAELFQQIQAEKLAMVKAGTIKKGKAYPVISEEEIPFDIPDTWVMARLQDVVFNRGQEVPSETFCYIDIGSINNKRQKLNTEDNVLEASKAPSRARKIVQLGDILYSTVRPYLHNMCIIDREFSHKPIASTGFAAMTCFEGIYNKYLFYYLLSPVFDSYANDTENAKGVAYPAINDDRLYRAVIAIPPTAEQKRIVAKLEEILPLIDRYEAAWNKLEEFNKRFPGDMQKSILQLAIQGKLVDQRSEEGTGEDLLRELRERKEEIIESGALKGRKTKPLQKITSDDHLMEIPNTWSWIRLGEAVEIFGRIGFRGYTKNDIVPKGTGAITISPSNILSNGKTSFDDCTYLSWEKYEESPEIKVYDGDILLVKTGSSYGKCGIVCNLPEKATINPQLAILKYITCDVKYLDYVLKSPMARTQFESFVIGTSIPTFSQEKLANLLLPLPPLAEQKRIVAKLEGILPLCERLK